MQPARQPSHEAGIIAFGYEAVLNAMPFITMTHNTGTQHYRPFLSLARRSAELTSRLAIAVAAPRAVCEVCPRLRGVLQARCSWLVELLLFILLCKMLGVQLCTRGGHVIAATEAKRDFVYRNGVPPGRA